MGYTWTTALSVGVEEIDEQHKELINRFNALLAAASQGKGKQEIGSIILFLNDYVIKHFSDEEKLQVKYSYPQYLSHKAEHKRFIEDFGRLKQELEAQGVTSSIVIAVQRRVGDWLINHICKVDQELGKYIRAAIARASTT